MNILLDADMCDFIQSVTYAMLVIGASKDDNINELHSSDHLFKLHDLSNFLWEEAKRKPSDSQ
jgi:hypothetical protein